VRGDVHVLLLLLLVQRERVHLGERHAPALARRRQERVRGGVRGAAAPGPVVPESSRGDGTASRAAPNVPGDPEGDAEAVPGDRDEVGFFCAAPAGDGDPPREAGLGLARLGGDRVDGETGGSSTAASREVSKSNGSGLDRDPRLRDAVDLGLGCGSPWAVDAGPLASRAWKSRAAGEDPGEPAGEPPRAAPVPLTETSPAPVMNPRMPAWRCAFPLRS
jgi:hypothetical protein